MRVDADTSTVFMARAGVHGEPIELQEDLDLVLGELHAQRLVPVDVRRAVIIPLDVEITIRVQLCIPPLTRITHERQRLERGAFGTRARNPYLATCILSGYNAP